MEKGGNAKETDYKKVVDYGYVEEDYSKEENEETNNEEEVEKEGNKRG